jgi:hypothetical protein
MNNGSIGGMPAVETWRLLAELAAGRLKISVSVKIRDSHF